MPSEASGYEAIHGVSMLFLGRITGTEVSSHYTSREGPIRRPPKAGPRPTARTPGRRQPAEQGAGAGQPGAGLGPMPEPDHATAPPGPGPPPPGELPTAVPSLSALVHARAQAEGEGREPDSARCRGPTLLTLQPSRRPAGTRRPVPKGHPRPRRVCASEDR
jgi:hypothetical protein